MDALIERKHQADIVFVDSKLSQLIQSILDIFVVKQCRFWFRSPFGFAGV
jgi:hypothetical protein